MAARAKRKKAADHDSNAQDSDPAWDPKTSGARDVDDVTQPRRKRTAPHGAPDKAALPNVPDPSKQESQRKDLQECIKQFGQQEKLKQELMKLERQIFEMESKYLSRQSRVGTLQDGRLGQHLGYPYLLEPREQQPPPRSLGEIPIEHFIFTNSSQISRSGLKTKHKEATALAKPHQQQQAASIQAGFRNPH